MSENPLSEYFRTPEMYITLPSEGKFYPNGAYEPSETGEIPVYPMTAIDEITYRTPDALYNGAAVASVINSCVPNIKDPWAMPAIDMSTVLAAIRIASFGPEMEISTACPKCKEISDFSLDLRLVLNQIVAPEYDEPMPIGDLKVYFKPLSYKEVNDNSKINFEEQRLVLIVQDAEIPESEKIAKLAEAFTKVSVYTIETIAKNISHIDTPSAVVDDPAHILDYLRNCDRHIYEAIKEKILTQRSTTEIKPLHIKCSNEKCGHEYEQPYTLDMSNFFE
jgi:hypothetical protein